MPLRRLDDVELHRPRGRRRRRDRRAAQPDQGRRRGAPAGEDRRRGQRAHGGDRRRQQAGGAPRALPAAGRDRPLRLDRDPAAGRRAPRLDGRGRPPGRRAHGQGRAARHRRGQLHPRPAPRADRRRAGARHRAQHAAGRGRARALHRHGALRGARPRRRHGRGALPARARAAPTRWTSPSSCATRTPEAVPDAGFDFDLFVIGGGSGGVRAARIAAEARRPGRRSPRSTATAAPA